MPGKKVVGLLFFFFFSFNLWHSRKKVPSLAACCFEEDVTELLFEVLLVSHLWVVHGWGFLPDRYSQTLISRRAITVFWMFCLFVLCPTPPSPVLPLIYVDNSNFKFQYLGVNWKMEKGTSTGNNMVLGLLNSVPSFHL